MSKKSLNQNLILYSIKTSMSLIFPLISFPYISRVLSPSGLGHVNYSSSILTYFVLIASLGISTYAIREGAPIRKDKIRFQTLANELFSINIVTTIMSYILLFAVLIFVSNFEYYKITILIYSLSIIFNTIGVEWVFNIYEDYTYITLRSILFQFISLILMLLFVKNKEDLYIYVWINVLSNVGSNILNFFYARKYFHFHFTLNKELNRHVKPIVIIFFTTFATTIYSNIDTTMLGWMVGDKEVGVYAVATKLYSIIKAMLNSIVIVFSARLMYLIKNETKEYQDLLQYAYDILVILIVPIIIGSFCFSTDIIDMIAGNEYKNASIVMSIINCSLFFACVGNLISTGALLAINKEKLMLIATAIGSIINIILNAILIPILASTGAALATLFTEMLIFSILFLSFKINLKLPVKTIHSFKCIFATLPFWVVNYYGNLLRIGERQYVILEIILSAFLYFIFLFVLRDELIIQFINKFQKIIIGKGKKG